MSTRTIKRGLVIAAIVGVVLSIINHGEHLPELFAGDGCTNCAFKVGLNFVVPFVVSVVSSHLSQRANQAQGQSD